MNIIESLALFTIMVALAAIPGTSVALVVARSISSGIANGFAVVAGIVLGDITFILLAIYGLSVVVETMSGWFTVLKYLGGIYLIWLGISLYTSKDTTIDTLNTAVEKSSILTSLCAGLVLTLSDVKAIIFYASLFPIFVNISSLNITNILSIIAITILSVGGVKALYAIFANNIATFVRQLKLEIITKKMAAGVIAGAGGYLLFKA